MAFGSAEPILIRNSQWLPASTKVSAGSSVPESTKSVNPQSGPLLISLVGSPPGKTKAVYGISLSLKSLLMKPAVVWEIYPSPFGSRAEITSLISKYIKENDLKNSNKENKKFISPDKYFSKILKKKNEDGILINLDEDELDNITYMNYQKYIQHHFTKI